MLRLSVEDCLHSLQPYKTTSILGFNPSLMHLLLQYFRGGHFGALMPARSSPQFAQFILMVSWLRLLDLVFHHATLLPFARLPPSSFHEALSSLHQRISQTPPPTLL